MSKERTKDQNEVVIIKKGNSETVYIGEACKPLASQVKALAEKLAKEHIEGKETWVIYEEDDDLEVLMEGSLDEIKERLISLFKEGFCDFHLVPKKEYLKRKEEISLR